jgi:hypothetical protein
VQIKTSKKYYYAPIRRAKIKIVARPNDGKYERETAYLLGGWGNIK